MPLLAKLVRRPIDVAVGAVAVVVLAQLSLGSASAAVIGSPGLLAAVGGTPYLDALAQDNPAHLWRLNDTAAATSVDSAGTDNLTVDSSATRGSAGPMTAEPSIGTTFSGLGTVPATTTRSVTGPQSFSVEAWFKTSSTTGGKIIGFGDSRTGNSSNYDRHLYLTNAGNVTFGVYPTTYRHMTSPLTYNNGQWHHVVGSMNSAGMDLFVDGRRVAHDTSTAGAELFSGYWRVGGDNTTNWPAAPSRFSFNGSLADVAVYSSPLTLSRVKAHYAAAGRSVDTATAPTDGYGAAVYGDNPSFYWRLNETSGTSAKDEMSGNPVSGTYSSGTVLGEPGPSAGTGTSIRFPGTSTQTVSSNQQVGNPTVYSLETWFKTTSTQGGRLIGFGSARTSFSASYDRQIYLLNSGKLRYGVHTSQTTAIESPLTYNDGGWHHVVATQGSAGSRLFVDGVQVASGTAGTGASYSGYWRAGTDHTGAGTTSESLAGSLDEAAVYPAVLSPAAVQQHYQQGKPPPVNVAPTAAFTSTVKKLKVTFDAAASADADGTISGYAWDFGDGSSGTGVNPEHRYAATGTYTVALTVTDDKDTATLITHDVTVTADVPPIAAFSSECTDLDCTFDAAASVDSDGEITSYSWAFGDGTEATGTTATHSFAAAGSYDVVLTVTDDDGESNATTQTVTVAARNNPPTAALTADCTDLDCTFDGTGSADPDGGITEYAWDFGDGRSGAAQQGTHSYAEPGVYSVVLTVTDTRGATGSASIVVTAVAPNKPPVAAFGSVCTDLECTFDAAGASDPDGSVTGYAWDFGDGTSGTGVTPSHTFAAGTHTVTLTVTDDDGATDRISHDVTAVEPNRPPVAEFTSLVTDLSVAFNASGSRDSDGTIDSYSWDFGDGSNGTGITPTHKYHSAGQYRVSVTVTDNDGATATTSADVTATYPILGADTFTRTVTSGLGTAETGGAWTTSGSGAVFSVADGSARVSVPSSRSTVARLAAVSSRDVDLVHSVWLEQTASSSGSYLYSSARITSAGDYRAKIKIVPNGVTTLQIVKAVGSADTALSAAVVVPDVQYVAGQKLRVRVQAFGASPTTVRAKVWSATGTEPAAWLTSITDSATGMQVPGAVGVACYLAGSFSAAVVRWDDLVATERTDLVTEPTP